MLFYAAFLSIMESSFSHKTQCWLYSRHNQTNPFEVFCVTSQFRGLLNFHQKKLTATRNRSDAICTGICFITEWLRSEWNCINRRVVKDGSGSPCVRRKNSSVRVLRVTNRRASTSDLTHSRKYHWPQWVLYRDLFTVGVRLKRTLSYHYSSVQAWMSLERRLMRILSCNEAEHSLEVDSRWCVDPSEHEPSGWLAAAVLNPEVQSCIRMVQHQCLVCLTATKILFVTTSVARAFSLTGTVVCRWLSRTLFTWTDQPCSTAASWWGVTYYGSVNTRKHSAFIDQLVLVVVLIDEL